MLKCEIVLLLNAMHLLFYITRYAFVKKIRQSLRIILQKNPAAKRILHFHGELINLRGDFYVK